MQAVQQVGRQPHMRAHDPPLVLHAFQLPTERETSQHKALTP